MSTLGERIKEIRTERHLTQLQFAESLSVSRPFISRMESNKETPSDSLIKLICSIYDINFPWLKFEMGTKLKNNMPRYKYVQENLLQSDNIFLFEDCTQEEKRNYSFCISVLINILKNPNIKEGSHRYYIDKIKSLLTVVDHYFSAITMDIDLYTDISDKFEYNLSLQRELRSQLFNIVTDASEALKNEEMDELIDE